MRPKRSKPGSRTAPGKVDRDQGRALRGEVDRLFNDFFRGWPSLMSFPSRLFDSDPFARRRAADASRSLIEESRLVPENGRLEIELAGDLAGILALSSESKKPVFPRDGLQVTMVAGARNCPNLLLITSGSPALAG